MSASRSTLTPTETVGLALQVRMSREARNELVEGYLHLANEIARHYANVSNAEYEDLRSEGYLALTEAADSYDPLAGWTFESYARPRIRSAVYKFLGWSGGKKLPAQARTEIHQMKLHRERLEQQLGRKPTTAELAASLGCSEAGVGDLVALAIEAKSLDAKVKVGEDDGDELIALIPAPDNSVSPEREAGIEQAIHRVGYLLEHTEMSKRERLIIEQFYGVGADGTTATHDAIGAMLGISGSRVGQIKAEALAKLKQVTAQLPATFNDEEMRPEIEPASPSATLHQCYICQREIKRWGSSSFKDWTYLAQPWRTSRPGTVPRAWVCYGCSQTEQHRQHLNASLEARRWQLDHTTAVRLELLDPKTGKMTVHWVYAKTQRKTRNVKARKAGTSDTPVCSICHQECEGPVADIVATGTYKTRRSQRYAMKFICTTCYGRVGQKWEARKVAAGLVKASASATEETATRPGTSLSPIQKAWLALSLRAKAQGDEGASRWAFHQIFNTKQPKQTQPQRKSAQARLHYLITQAAKQVKACTTAWRVFKDAAPPTRIFTLANNAGVMLTEDAQRKTAIVKAAAKRLFLAKSRYGELCQAARPLAPVPAPDQPGYGLWNMTLQGPFYSPAPEPKTEEEIGSIRKDAAAKLAALLPPIARRRVIGWQPAPPQPKPEWQWQWPPTAQLLLPAPAQQ